MIRKRNLGLAALAMSVALLPPAAATSQAYVPCECTIPDGSPTYLYKFVVACDGNHEPRTNPCKPTDSPEPTPEPSTDPTPAPTTIPTPEPSTDPTPEPSTEPTPEPSQTPAPSAEPSNDPSPIPTETPEPTADPTIEPTETPEPTPEPTIEPTATPSPVPTASPSPTPSATKAPEQTVAGNAQERQLLAWVNEERAQQGLSALTMREDLVEVARAKSTDMMTNRYFAHTSPTLGSAGDMLTAAGIRYNGWGENIARYGDLYKAHVGLMTSEGHRRNILSKSYTSVGIGIVQDSSGTYYITQIFMR